MQLRFRDDAPGLLRLDSESIPSRLGLRARAVAALTGFFALAFVTPAVADGGGWWCYIPYLCQAKAAVDFTSDPLGFICQKIADANVWFLGRLLDLAEATSKVDLTSPGFLKQYAIIFAASTFLTVALWMIAVAKRAVRGVGLTTAVSEAIGFLLLQFVVNALAPAALALLVTATDEITKALAPNATGNFKPFLTNLMEVLSANPQQAVVAVIAVNLLMMFSAVLMWIELLIRGAAIYVAVGLGSVVNAGLVDKDLWHKSKKWFAAVLAIDLSKPVLFALLGLGGAINGDSSGTLTDAVSKILLGSLILFLAVFASATLYRWLPAFGDEMAELHHGRKTATNSGFMAAVDGPAGHANRAMANHIQDAVVGGGRSGGHGSATGSGAQQATKWSSGGGAAVAGPLGPVTAAGKAGMDVAKAKAADSPGAQGTDASSGTGPNGTGGGGPPAMARPSDGGSASVVPPGTASGSAPPAPPPPASGYGGPTGSGPPPIPPPPNPPVGPAAPDRSFPGTSKDQ